MVSNFLEDDLDQWWVDKMYIHVAFVSATHSTDLQTQGGAALVIPKGGVLLKNWSEVPTRLQKVGYPKTPCGAKHCVEHAERRVIYQAVMNKLHTGGLTLYTTWGVCSECARTAIQFGIGRVVTLRALVERTPLEMEDSIREGVTMLRDVGVPVIGWYGKLSPKYSIRFNGEVLSGEDMG